MLHGSTTAAFPDQAQVAGRSLPEWLQLNFVTIGTEGDEAALIRAKNDNMISREPIQYVSMRMMELILIAV
jgi:hypothetical protein